MIAVILLACGMIFGWQHAFAAAFGPLPQATQPLAVGGESASPAGSPHLRRPSIHHQSTLIGPEVWASFDGDVFYEGPPILISPGSNDAAFRSLRNVAGCAWIRASPSAQGPQTIVSTLTSSPDGCSSQGGGVALFLDCDGDVCTPRLQWSSRSVDVDSECGQLLSSTLVRCGEWAHVCFSLREGAAVQAAMFVNGARVSGVTMPPGPGPEPRRSNLKIEGGSVKSRIGMCTDDQLGFHGDIGMVVLLRNTASNTIGAVVQQAMKVCATSCM